ncbi:DUF2919 domain-containing protein [Shewanella woodyi]|uniref:DUF2919 domain-containing protein n=1 Tax=Shewanella woodyi (strain ATCC 51908 / MS32) TaxID=392500 RepID=B1KJT3_SHEWM|nr:DUF2919 domain-containing protein [Shewanella woodyi]ACA87120.1 conserved hypothetical protein [Shewanella woodyi ATCC 51908]
MNFSNITWLDDNGHIKPPIYLYFILIFLARGWCIFIASLTQASDRAALVALFYPQKADFMMALAAGAGALLLYGFIIAERKRSPVWVRPLFNQFRWVLLLLLLVDGGLLIERSINSHYLYSWSMGLDGLILFWSFIYLFKSKRLSHYFSDWKREE